MEFADGEQNPCNDSRGFSEEPRRRVRGKEACEGADERLQEHWRPDAPLRGKTYAAGRNKV